MKHTFLTATVALAIAGISPTAFSDVVVGQESPHLWFAQQDETPSSSEIEDDSLIPEPEVTDPSESQEPDLIQNETPNTLEVLDLGAEPRQELRFVPTIGDQQQTATTMMMSATVMMEGEELSAFVPPATTMIIDTEVTDINASGDIYVEFEYIDIQVEDLPDAMVETAEFMRSQLEDLIGAEGMLVFDERGNIIEYSLEPIGDEDRPFNQSFQQLSESMQQFSNPFPEEAVGIGAIWQVPQVVNINGMEIRQITTYELVERNGTQIELVTRVEQDADLVMDDLMGLPVEITSMTSSGEGSSFFDLSQVMPISSEITSITNSVMEITAPEITASIDMQMIMEMSIMAVDPVVDESSADSE